MNDIAMETLPAEKPNLKRWLFDPFTYLAGGPAMLRGVALILLSGLIAHFSSSHFDGVLDFHSGAVSPLWVSFAEGLVNWLIMAVLLLITGKLVSKSKFRAIDVFGTQALARWPGIFAALVSLLPSFQTVCRFVLWKVTRAGPAVTITPLDAVAFALAVVVMLCAFVWMIWLMYRAFSISCNVKGVKSGVAFGIALLIGEILSKIAIAVLFYLAIAA
jgi:hypothetical protein